MQWISKETCAGDLFNWVFFSYSGRTVQLGPKCKNILPADKYDDGLDYNEYIVFQPSQVTLRYLVQFRQNKQLPRLTMKNAFTSPQTEDEESN
jgi:hypothetical protein